MKNLQKLLLVALLPLLSHCSGPKYASPDESTETQLVFGNGGGIAGLVTEYVLLENGQLFKKKSTDKTYTPLPKVKKRQVEQIFSNYAFLNIHQITHNDPSNRYRFIHYKSQDAAPHQITWSDATPGLENQLQLFYDNLMLLVKQKN